MDAQNHHTKVPIEVKKLIVKLKDEGKSYAEIGKIVGRPRPTVQSVIQNFKNNKSFEIAPGRGRKKILTPREERVIEKLIKTDPKISAPKIAANLDEYHNISINPQTIRNVIHSKGYKGCVSRKKPFIAKNNAAKRLDYATAYANKPIEFWEQVIFVDEKKFNILGSDGRRWVWRKPNTALNKKNVTSTVKHGGGNVMVWGSMAANGVGNLEFVECTMDKYKYLSILRDNLRASAVKLGIDNNFSLVQDNDPKHNSELVRTWLLYNCKSVLPHPPQSPDLNPIEHLWHCLELRVRQHAIKSKEQLKNIIIEEWNKISPEITKKLVLSMPNRLRQVITAKGYHTSY